MTAHPDLSPAHGPSHPAPVVYRPRALTPLVSPALAAKPSPLALLKALRRRWLLAICLAVPAAAVAAAAAYSVMPPAKYTARALLHVNSVQPRIILQVHEMTSDYAAYQRTQLALIKSKLVLEKALKQDGVKDLKAFANRVDPADQIEWLEKELQVDFSNGSEILRLSMSSTDPREPMVLVNAVTEAYMDEVANVETKDRRDRYDLLKQTWERYQDRLRDKRKELKRLAGEVGSDDKKTLASLQQQEIARLGRAEDELARVGSELRGLRVEEAVLRESREAPSAVTRAMVENALDNDPSIRTLNDKIAAAQRSYTETARLVRSANDPSLQRARSQAEAVRAELAARRARLYPEVAQQLRDKSRGDRGAEESTTQVRIKILTEVENSLAADIKRLSERGRTMTRTAADLFSIQEEIAHAEEVSRTIGAEVEALTVELLAKPRIRLFEKATLPRTKDESRPLKTAGMAGAGVFALVLVGVSLLEFRSRRVDSAEEIVQGLGMTLVGTLPAMPGPGRLRNLGEAEDLRLQELLTESVDSARTALLHASRTDSVRVVMVASALSGEGKTSLSCHLASSLARASRRTLLIDGDLRRPSAHRLFDLPQGPGLSEVLRGEADVADVAQPTQANGLWLMTAGMSDSKAVQALAYKDLRAMFDRLKEQFDFIIIDSSPVLPVADALLIGQHADAVLFSVMRAVSRLPKVHAAYERMSAYGIRMLGAVVAGEAGETYGRGYQYASALRDQA